MILHLLLAVSIQDGLADPAAQAAFRAAEDAGRAASVRPASDGEPTCRRDGSTLEINACFAEDLRREEARMDRYLAAARGRLREEPASQAAAWLDAGQSAWAAYADIRCDGVHDKWKQGTIRTVMALSCRIDATRQRSHDIWIDHLTYADSTPPVLPEPIGAASEAE